MTSYKGRWSELREEGIALLETLSEELVYGDSDLAAIIDDIVLQPYRNRDDEGDYYYYSSKNYASEHVEELQPRYSTDLRRWLGNWQELLREVWNVDIGIPSIPKKGLPEEADVKLYLALRGPTPEGFPDSCSFGLVLELLDGAIGEREREERSRILSQYIKRHPELKEEIMAHRIPASYAEELSPYNIAVSDLVTYYNNTRLIPSLCGIHARRLLREYIDKFGMLPEDADDCLEALEVNYVEEVAGHMTRLKGCLTREISTRIARIRIKEEAVGTG